MNEHDRELLVKELATVNAALLTSFGAETKMLMTLQNALRERLGLSAERDDEVSVRPAAA
jgi:hypothetical protein